MLNSSYPGGERFRKKGESKKFNHYLTLRPVRMLLADSSFPECAIRFADFDRDLETLLGRHFSPYFELHGLDFR